MSNHSIVPWASTSREIVPQTARTPADIAGRAVQLRKREISQIVSAFSARHFEMATTFIWSKATAALKTQLASLGSEFIGEMLQRPDIGPGVDIISAVTDSEAIALAEDLGVVTATDAMRLRHSHEAINHFARYESDVDSDEDQGMTEEEALSCLRTCTNSILGQPKLQVAQDFANFRRELEERTFKIDDDEIIGLRNSPYFFLKTTLSVLLALLRSATGAQLEHAVRNTNVILPEIWPRLRKPEKWQAGQAYAELYAEGKKEAVNSLKASLSKVDGFDFVPENLRSATYTRAAKEVLEAHQGMNNFYNEPMPMRALASLGSTIPSPAFPVCMTATLCVWLGNSYGHSWEAADSAIKVFKGQSAERWKYYLEEVFVRDREILVKLTHAKPAERLIELVRMLNINPEFISSRLPNLLIAAAKDRKVDRIGTLAQRLLERSFTK